MHWPSISTIKNDFPELVFTKGQCFSWSPNTATVSYTDLQSITDIAQLLHEIAHAKLNHTSYQHDISLIDLERAAWEYASKELAPRYDITIDMNDNIIQESLDTYRHWLHARSICPECGAVGIQHKPSCYRCFNCYTVWRVNEAKNCQLKRYKK